MSYHRERDERDLSVYKKKAKSKYRTNAMHLQETESTDNVKRSDDIITEKKQDQAVCTVLLVKS